MADLPKELVASLKTLEPDLASDLKDALSGVAGDLGPREMAVLDRLINGINDGAKPQELNAFVRLLPVTVSRAVQPVIEPLTAA